MRVKSALKHFYRNNIKSLRPALWVTIKEGYKWSKLNCDFWAGLTVAIIAFPLSMALGIASGGSLQNGLITAIVAGFLISLLGGSKLQIGGPTGAFVVVILSVINKYGFDGMVLATIMAGLMLMIAGFLRLGSVIKYIPQPVILGFTSGIAVTIFTSQVKEFLGLNIAHVPSEFLEKWAVYFKNITSTNVSALIIGVVSLFLLWGIRKYFPKAPGQLIVIILGGLAVSLRDVDVHTIGSRFGDIKVLWPHLVLPAFSIEKIIDVIPAAFTIAFLAGIESLLSAVVADSMSGDRHHSNTELVAQGVANVASALTGGIPATGAIARTAANIRAGGVSPVAGILHALFILLFMAIFTPFLKYIPFPCLAAILFMVAWNMSETKEFIHILKSDWEDKCILLITFILTLLLDLTQAIAIGIIISSLLFMRRMSQAVSVKPHILVMGKPEHEPIPEGVFIYTIEGPFFFGSAARIRMMLEMNVGEHEVYIINLENTPFIDSTAAKTLAMFIREIQEYGNKTVLCCGNKSVLIDLKKKLPESLIPSSRRHMSLRQAILDAKAFVSKAQA